MDPILSIFLVHSYVSIETMWPNASLEENDKITNNKSLLSSRSNEAVGGGQAGKVVQDTGLHTL